MNKAKLYNIAHMILISSLAFASMSLAGEIGKACQRGEVAPGANYHCIEATMNDQGMLFEGGYWVAFDCSDTAACESGAKCVRTTGTNFNVCLAACESDTQCRNGYACQKGGVCLPRR